MQEIDKIIQRKPVRKEIMEKLKKPWVRNCGLNDKEGAMVNNSKEIIWIGEWKDGKQWNGRGMMYWNEYKSLKCIWVFKGNIVEGHPEGDGMFLRYSTDQIRAEEGLELPPNKVTLRYDKQKNLMFGVLIEEGKEYDVVFQNRDILSRNRTFLGVKKNIPPFLFANNLSKKFPKGEVDDCRVPRCLRIPKKTVLDLFCYFKIIYEKVGKTALKIRLIGSTSNEKNKEAHSKVQQEKKEQDMTHGVEVTTWQDDLYKMLFSVWDFAGHEEYHVAHSFFFSAGSVYLLLFDCSVDMDKMVTKNKLLYWLNFLQTQVGENARVILLATKYDLMRMEYGTVLDIYARERLRYINIELHKLIKTNNIILKIHKFDASTVFKPALMEEERGKKNPAKMKDRMEEEGSSLEESEPKVKDSKEESFVFFPINNRELSRNKSGLATIYTILAKEYDNIEHSISTTLRHKLVYEAIQNCCVTPEKGKTKPFLDVSVLKDALILKAEKEDQPEALAASKKLESLLVDLHKLGIIIFFDHDILRETIITTPEWFNRVFKAILDYGRREVSTLIDSIYNNLIVMTDEGKYRAREGRMFKKFLSIFAKVQDEEAESILYASNVLQWLRANAKKKLVIQEIWSKEEELNKSILNKVSFDLMMSKLEMLQKKLREEGNTQALQGVFKESQHDICQLIHSIDHATLSAMVRKILGTDYEDQKKHNYLIDLLVKYSFVLPKGRGKFTNDRFANLKQNYLVPLLFPVNKPHQIILQGNIKIEQVVSKHEWTVQYELPFKPSSMWK